MFSLTNKSTEEIKKLLQRFETPRSAILPALYVVQREHGWIPPEAVPHMSKLMDLPEAWINEVLYFYTMYNKEKVGKHHVQVCCNISCAMNGGRELIDHLCKHFECKEGAVSEDGKFTFTRVECLGSCDTAPMMQVNDEYHENLTKESAVALLEKMV